METYQVASNGCNLQVYAAGNQERKIGILCLHGGPGSGAQAIMDLPAFQALEESYFCVYFDQRGCGNSAYDITKGIRKEDILEDVRCVLRDMKERYDCAHILVWGGSFGGCLLAMSMQENLEMADGFLFSSPAITFSRAQALTFFEHMQAPYQSRFTQGQPEVTEQATSTPEEFFQDPKIQEFIYSPYNPSNSLKHICAMGNWFYQQNFKGIFEKGRKPMLILQGKEDPICLYTNIDQEISMTRNNLVEYHLFEHCGHAVFEDQEQAFLSSIHAFIKERILC